MASDLSAEALADRAIAVGAWQKRHELRQLITLLRRRRLRTVVEIGTMMGGTLWLWCQLAEPDALIISVDLPGGLPYGGGYGEQDIPRLKEFAKLRQRLHLIRRDSHDDATRLRVARLVGGSQVDILFIDGDHSDDGVRSDFKLYSPLVPHGGLTVFHDIVHDPPNRLVPTVEHAWKEITESMRFTEFYDPDDVGPWGPWGGIGVLYNGCRRDV